MQKIKTIEDVRKKCGEDAIKLKGIKKNNPLWIALLEENIALMEKFYEDLTGSEKKMLVAMQLLKKELNKRGK